MKFIFVDENGDPLSQNSLIEKGESLRSGDETTFQIFSEHPTKSPGIYLKASTFLGEVKYPGTESVYKDYSDILHWGSKDSQSGLYIKVEEEWIPFTFEQGSSYNNMIKIPQAVLDSSGTFSVTLKFVEEATISRRLFIGVEIDDS